jgi:preprotein translocase subunit YajC
MHVLTATSPLLLAQEGGGLAAFLPLIILVVVFYFLLIRPQQRRSRQQRELVASVQTGDRIVTLGGIHGTVRFVDDDVIHLEVAPGTTLTFSKQAVARKVVDAETGAEDD